MIALTAQSLSLAKLTLSICFLRFIVLLLAEFRCGYAMFDDLVHDRTPADIGQKFKPEESLGTLICIPLRRLIFC